MNAPLLSICIATRNRAAYIGETLDSIIAQSTSDVEIVVLDGASTDNTQEVVAGRQRRFPQLRYSRQETNGGVDQDFDKTVGLARGEYCWLMSDDDLLKPGAIAAVMGAVRHGYSVAIVNAEVRNADLSTLIETKRLQFDGDRSYSADDLERFFIEAGAYLTFIGCVVMKRELWLARERVKYYGSLFIHVGVIFQDPLPEGAFVAAEPLISIRYGNAMWRPREFEIWMSKWPTLVWSLPGISDAAKSKLAPRTPLRLLKKLVVYRANGSYSLPEYRKWIQPQLQSRKMRAAARIIAIVPGVIVNTIAYFYLRLFRRNSRLELADLRNSRYSLRNCFARPAVP